MSLRALLPPKIKGELAAPAVYLLLAVLVGGKGALLFWERVIGSVQMMAPARVWKLWWTAHAIGDLGRSPLTTDLLGFPNKSEITVLVPGLTDALLLLPATSTFGAVVAHNLGVILSLTAAAWVCSLLLRSLGIPRPAAFFGGLIYGFSPQVLGVLATGAAHLAAGVWLPLLLLAILRLGRPHRVWHVVAVGGIFVAGSLCSGWHALVMLIGVLLGALLARGSWNDKEERKSFLKALGYAVGGSALVLLPVIDHVMPRFGERGGGVGAWAGSSLGLASLFTPGKTRLPESFLVALDLGHFTSYLPWVGLLLGLVAAVTEARWRWWLLGVLGAGLLTWGSSGRLPDIVYLFIAVVSAGAIATLSGRVSAKLLVPGACALLCAELMVMSPAPLPLPSGRLESRPVHLALATVPPRRVLLELPISSPRVASLNSIVRTQRESMVGQMVHRLPLLSAPVRFPVRPGDLHRRGDRLIAYLAALEAWPLVRKRPSPPRSSYRPSLFSLIVLHRNLMNPISGHRVESALRVLFGRPVYQRGGATIFDATRMSSPSALSALPSAESGTLLAYLASKLSGPTLPAIDGVELLSRQMALAYKSPCYRGLRTNCDQFARGFKAARVALYGLGNRLREYHLGRTFIPTNRWADRCVNAYLAGLHLALARSYGVMREPALAARHGKLAVGHGKLGAGVVLDRQLHRADNPSSLLSGRKVCPAFFGPQREKPGGKGERRGAKPKRRGRGKGI